MIDNKKAFILLGIIAFIVALSFLIIWALNAFERKPSASVQTESPTSTSSMCYPASREQLDQIMAFVDGPYYLELGFREPFGSGYYVAAQILKENDPKPIGVGVWYVFGPKSDPRIVLMVNTIAKIATPDLTLANETNLDFSMSDDEAIHVKACAAED